MNSQAPSFIVRPNGSGIAYRTINGKGPGVIFLPGLKSDMKGTKALALEQACISENRQFTRLDYSGHGESSGHFVDGTIGQWTEDTIAVLDVIKGPQVLVGSSLGGWIMLLVALARPDRVVAMVGVAPAPDFTEDLMWNQMQEDIRNQIIETGRWDKPSPYDPEPTPITRALIEDGRNHLLLRDRIAITCPTRLIHGLADPDVPWQVSIKIQEQLKSEDVTVTLIKEGDHRLSDDQNLQRIVDLTMTTASHVSG